MDEQLVQIGWYCWRGDDINSSACRSDCVPIYVPKEWEKDVTDVLVRKEI